MNLKKSKISANSISIVEIFQIFWKDKVLIVIISLAFCIFFTSLKSYFLNNFKNQQVLTNIKVTFENNSNNVDLYYKKLLLSYSKIYNIENLKFKLIQTNILYFFSENKKKYNDFDIYFKKLNISADEYFKKNYKTDTKNYYLAYPKELNGELFLKEYITWLFNQSQTVLVNNLKEIILHDILVLKKNKEFLSKIGSEKFKKESKNLMTEKNEDFLFDPHNFFTFDINNIDLKILFSTKLIQHLDSFIFEPASLKFKSEVIPGIYLNSTRNFGVLGLLFGFFLSLIIIFFKNLIKKN
jgi:hypothetical protein